jgi:hypothetical protein
LRIREIRLTGFRGGGAELNDPYQGPGESAGSIQGDIIGGTLKGKIIWSDNTSAT